MTKRLSIVLIRQLTRLSVAVLLCIGVAMASGWGLSPSIAANGKPEGTPGKGPSKLPDIVKQTMSKAAQARAQHQPDLSELSNPIVKVSPDGEIELLFHALGEIGRDEEEDLIALGGTIVYNISRPAEGGVPAVGMIQAWVPLDQIQFAEELDWGRGGHTAGGTATPTPIPNNHPINPIESEGVPLHQC